MGVSSKRNASVARGNGSRFSGRWAKALLLVLGAIVVVLLALLWREGGERTSQSALRGSNPRTPSLALALFRRQHAAPERATGFTGRVLDAHGAPLANAQVCAACASCEASHALPSACVRSDADGAYGITQLSAGGYYLSALANDHQPLTAFDGAAAFLAENELRSGVDLVLQAGGARLAGHVLDATGGPIARARVRALRLVPPRLSVDIVTDDEGRFELALLPGPLELIANAEGYAPVSKTLEAPNRDVSVLLTPESSIRGKVVSAPDGAGVEGIEVRALPLQSFGAGLFRSVLSNAEGEFTLRGLEPAHYLLVAKGERWREREAVSVELGVAAQVDNVRVTLKPAATLSGHVRASKGAEPCREGFVALGPIAGPGGAEQRTQAPLSIMADRLGQTAMIQADGSVFFPGVVSGAYTVQVHCVGHSFSDGPRHVEVASEPLADLSWTVTAAPSLTVTVTDRGGRAVPGAAFDVGFLAPDGNPAGYMALLAGPDGRTKVPDLEPGKYTLTARTGPSVPVELTSRDKHKEVKLVLPPGGTIELRVVTAQQDPVGGASVSVFKASDDSAGPSAQAIAASVRPQTEGLYQIGPLPPGLYVVRVTDAANPPVEAGREGTRLEVSDGATVRAQVVLRRAGKIEGQVLDDQGAPVANVWVSAQSESQRSRPEEITLMMAPLRVLTDLHGGFTLSGLAEDANYLVRVTEPGGAVVQKSGARPGERVALTLPSSAAISGEVVAANGRPLQRYTLQATHVETGATRMAAVADALGRFAVSGITPGTVEISISGEAGAFVQSTVQLLPGKRVTGLRLAQSQSAASAPPAAAPSVTAEAARSNGT